MFSWLIHDSKAIFAILYDRHILYNRLQKRISSIELSEIILKHEEVNEDEQRIIERYRNKTIRNNQRLKRLVFDNVAS